MNLRDLKYLVALADALHFGKAAQACFVSQPSLSIQIKKLEATLGVELLERSSRSVLLTDIGKIIVEEARELLQRAETIQTLAKQAQDPFSGELNVGIIPTLTTYLLPDLIPEITKTETFPKLSVYIAEQQTASLLLHLKQGKLDAALVSLPVEQKEFVVEPLFEEAFMLALPVQHALAKEKSIKFSALKNHDLLMLEEGHCLRDQILALCEEHQIKEARHFRAANLEVLRYMVASKVGITILPSLACHPMKGICYLPFNLPLAKRRIGLIWRSSSPKKPLLEKMVQFIRPLMAKHKGIKALN